jgi:hypothetical protein
VGAGCRAVGCGQGGPLEHQRLWAACGRSSRSQGLPPFSMQRALDVGHHPRPDDEVVQAADEGLHRLAPFRGGLRPGAMLQPVGVAGLTAAFARRGCGFRRHYSNLGKLGGGPPSPGAGVEQRNCSFCSSKIGEGGPLPPLARRRRIVWFVCRKTSDALFLHLPQRGEVEGTSAARPFGWRAHATQPAFLRADDPITHSASITRFGGWRTNRHQIFSKLLIRRLLYLRRRAPTRRIKRPLRCGTTVHKNPIFRRGCCRYSKAHLARQAIANRERCTFAFWRLEYDFIARALFGSIASQRIGIRCLPEPG